MLKKYHQNKKKTHIFRWHLNIHNHPGRHPILTPMQDFHGNFRCSKHVFIIDWASPNLGSQSENNNNP